MATSLRIAAPGAAECPCPGYSGTGARDRAWAASSRSGGTSALPGGRDSRPPCCTCHSQPGARSAITPPPPPGRSPCLYLPTCCSPPSSLRSLPQRRASSTTASRAAAAAAAGGWLRRGRLRRRGWPADCACAAAAEAAPRDGGEV